jgi:tetratricopeptide (TPR) repeat protein
MKLTTIFLSAFMLLFSAVTIADATQDYKQLQKRWAEVNYTLKDKAQKEAFEALIVQADKATESHPDSAEVLIWSGIIKSSYAGAKGGLGALSLAKASKADLEKAMTINDTALSGSAYTSLGTLYFKVPGWPLGFGKDSKAKELLEKALTINSDGIDSNYFYAEFLADQRLYGESEKYLLKAQQAPTRPDRPLADKGRHDDIEVSLKKVRAKLASKK